MATLSWWRYCHEQRSTLDPVSCAHTTQPLSSNLFVTDLSYDQRRTFMTQQGLQFMNLLPRRSNEVSWPLSGHTMNGVVMAMTNWLKSVNGGCMTNGHRSGLAFGSSPTIASKKPLHSCISSSLRNKEVSIKTCTTYVVDITVEIRPSLHVMLHITQKTHLFISSWPYSQHYKTKISSCISIVCLMSFWGRNILTICSDRDCVLHNSFFFTYNGLELNSECGITMDLFTIPAHYWQLLLPNPACSISELLDFPLPPQSQSNPLNSQYWLSSTPTAVDIDSLKSLAIPCQTSLQHIKEQIHHHYSLGQAVSVQYPHIST